MNPVRFKSAVPQFTVRDVVRTAEYYRDVLGFEIAGYWGDPPVFVIVERDPIQVFFNRALPGTPFRTGRADGAYDAYFHVLGVEALADDLRSRGADVLDGPSRREYGQVELVVRDCNDLVLAFGESTDLP